MVHGIVDSVKSNLVQIYDLYWSLFNIFNYVDLQVFSFLLWATASTSFHLDMLPRSVLICIKLEEEAITYKVNWKNNSC